MTVEQAQPEQPEQPAAPAPAGRWRTIRAGYYAFDLPDAVAAGEVRRDPQANTANRWSARVAGLHKPISAHRLLKSAQRAVARYLADPPAEVLAPIDQLTVYAATLGYVLRRTGHRILPVELYPDGQVQIAGSFPNDDTCRRWLDGEAARQRRESMPPRTVVTITPHAERQFEVVQHDEIDGLMRVAPRRTRCEHDIARWVGPEHVRVVPADRVEPVPGDDVDDPLYDATCPGHEPRPATKTRPEAQVIAGVAGELAALAGDPLNRAGVLVSPHLLRTLAAALRGEQVAVDDSGSDECGQPYNEPGNGVLHCARPVLHALTDQIGHAAVRYPDGTPQHAAYRAELSRELDKFAAGEPPYGH